MFSFIFAVFFFPSMDFQVTENGTEREIRNDHCKMGQRELD